MSATSRALRVLIATALSAGCSSPAAGPDASPAGDAGADATSCVPRAEPRNQLPVAAWPEGGSLRVEYLHIGNNPDGTRVEEPLRASVVLFEGQAPYDGCLGANSPRPYLGPLVAERGVMACYDQTAHNLAFSMYHPSIQGYVDSRQYYGDGPDTLPLNVLDGESAGHSLQLARTEDARDPHDSVRHPNLWLGTGDASDLIRGAQHGIEPQAPSGDFPGLAADAGYDIAAGGVPFSGSTGAFLAPDFTLDMPTEAALFAGLSIDSSQDLPMGYSVRDGATIPAEWPAPLWYVGFMSARDHGDGAGVQSTLEYLCLGDAGRAGSNQNLSIPAELFQRANFPQTGSILTGLFTHTAWALNEIHRFDATGLNAALGSYQVIE